MSSGKVSLVGAGPGDPGLLTVRAAELLATADVVIYDTRANDTIAALAKPQCERIFAQTGIEALTIARAREGLHVVRLVNGDPFEFGRGGEEAQALRTAGVSFDVVPGVSSSVATPAYAGIPLTHADYSNAFTVATDCGIPAKSDATLVVLAATENLERIAQHLIANGTDAQTAAAAIENGTRPSQRTLVGTLATIASDVVREGLGTPVILVVGDVVALREQLRWFDRTPLFGKRVLVTRPAHQAERFVRALYARGVEPVLASTIAIVPPDDLHAAHRAIDDLASFRWIVFTSQNGVDAFFDRLTSLDADARYLQRIKVAAIGSKTAARLREYGVRADLVPKSFISEEIGRALIEKTNERERILIFRAQEARDALPSMLLDADRDVTVAPAYKTIFEVDPEFAEKVAYSDVLTFTSASTVRGFTELLGGEDRARDAARGKVVACIGPITADAAEEAGLHVDVVADVYTTDGLLDALEARLTLLA